MSSMITDPAKLNYICTARCGSYSDNFCPCGTSVPFPNNGYPHKGIYLCGHPNGQFAPDYSSQRCGFAERWEKQFSIFGEGEQ